MWGAINIVSPPNQTTFQPIPHASLLSTSLSTTSSSTSMWSDLSSQSSVDSLSSMSLRSSSSCDSIRSNKVSLAPEAAPKQQQQQQQRCNADVVPPELRKNPRRTASARSACPPKLVHQQDRKVNFVDNLVGMFQVLTQNCVIASRAHFPVSKPRRLQTPQPC